ncbi:MAG: homocysteine S-methyltransferase family protein [Bacilli bacterium]|jgi:5-methyltetrahydrofolate--homocysteine methyltransferase
MLKEILGKRIIIFDGAMGTLLQEKQKLGQDTSLVSIEDPEFLESIYLNYLESGADVITTNTFGSNSYKLEGAKYSLEKIVNASIDVARDALKKYAKKDKFLAYDIGPIGQLLAPFGALEFDRAYELFKEQVLLAKDKVDLFIIETMSDVYELKAAILAVKENSNLPVFSSMSFEADERTLMGTDVETYANIATNLGVDAIGVNCSLGPKELKPIVFKLLESTNLPVLVQPNAGLPCFKDGKTCYNIGAEEYVNVMEEFALSGVSVLGGCCGTTPKYIEALAKRCKNIKLNRVVNSVKTKASSSQMTVELGIKPLVCGERINPTGKKLLREALQKQDFDYVIHEAILQEKALADILDVNVGASGVDEVNVLPKVVKLIQEIVMLPLQLDSANYEALEKSARYYNGIPIINSVNGKQESMNKVFPIVKKYGALVIALTLDGSDLPKTALEREKIAERIIKEAKKYGISEERIIVDCLVLTASAQQAEVVETLKAVRNIKAKYKIKTALGISNVSFGLPNRNLLNKTFLVAALANSLDLAIINPLDKEMMDAISAFNVLYNKDVNATDYIAKQTDVVIEKKSETNLSLYDVVKQGLKDEAKKAVKELLKTMAPMDIINEVLIKALDEVGVLYETKKIFLPQLILSAEATKEAFEVIQKSFESKDDKKGPIILATVEGDIHDIGKNIVKVVLESYGYRVIDLGKDVKAEVVVEAYHKYKPKAIGLSALMTTTVESMRKTIYLLRKVNVDCPILVGGAVLTSEYAKEIDADYYCKDAISTVKLLEKIL